MNEDSLAFKIIVPVGAECGTEICMCGGSRLNLVEAGKMLWLPRMSTMQMSLERI
jgi:hypothetical protein